jgi:MarR family transcriptional regulator, organic hydroperoxide resistance regulator
MAAPDPSREAWRLFVQIMKLAKAQHRDIYADLELTLAQAQLLMVADRPLHMSGLADILVCDASNVTGLVDKLESRGLIERQTDASDRRVKMIALTDAGAEVRARLTERMSIPPPFIEALSLADKKALRDILGRALAKVGKRG